MLTLFDCNTKLSNSVSGHLFKIESNQTTFFKYKQIRWASTQSTKRLPWTIFGRIDLLLIKCKYEIGFTFHVAWLSFSCFDSLTMTKGEEIDFFKSPKKVLSSLWLLIAPFLLLFYIPKQVRWCDFLLEINTCVLLKSKGWARKFTKTWKRGWFFCNQGVISKKCWPYWPVTNLNVHDSSIVIWIFNQLL